jgi:uncharacterized protein (TIGR01777 family)
MKLVIPGGSGLLGRILSRYFHERGHEVVVLSRRVTPAPWRVVAWDGVKLGDWAVELEGADAVINLAGRSVNCRYHPRNRREMVLSRLDSTRVVGEAIARCGRPPRVWLHSSTATIYAHRFDAANDEATGILGGDEADAPDTWKFSIDLAKAWERTLDEAPTPHTRKVKLRTAIVMSPERGGAFDVLLNLVRRGLGGKTGDGLQFVSWIHEHDFAAAVAWLIKHGDISGVVNLAAPNPLINADFMRGLRRAWGIRAGLPTPEWLLEIGTFLMRTESELVLKSRRVVPGRLLAGGFEFQYPTWPDAAADLVRRWKELRGKALPMPLVDPHKGPSPTSPLAEEVAR